MNIFILDNDPRKAAQMVCDKHVNKMVIESAQMMSTVHRMLDGTPYRAKSKSGKTTQTYYRFDDERDELYYLAVHKFHGCTTWTAESKANYEWHYEHFCGLADEFTFRYGKKHKTFETLGQLLQKPPQNIPDIGLTDFYLAMTAYPECMVEGDAVQSYHNFYHADKPFAKWEKGRSAPAWWQGYKGPEAFISAA